MSGDNSSTGLNRLTLLGWILFFFSILVGIGMFAGFWPFSWLKLREPSVWRYGLEVVLLMIQVPLGYSAWKNVRRRSSTYKADRFVLALWALMSLAYVLESRFALQKGETWRPHIELMILWTMLFAIHAWGRKAEVPTPNDTALNNQSGIANDG